ncbi:MAG TPA: SGNH/GDSL hydrolase family protein [Terracidiphilus sp.]|nr:SGNH/GDSL hydrolase family protein [Terracidiphilus sp.]
MRIRLAVLFLALFAVAVSPLAASAQSNADSAHTHWVGTWAASPFGGDPWHSIPTLVGSTIRNVVHTSLAGSSLRVRLTNEFGKEALHVDAATIALSTGTSSLDAASLHTLTFGGQPTIVIPPGAEILSDPVPLATPAFTNLAISLYLPLQQISEPSVHSSAQQDNYIVTGNHVSDASLADPVIVPSWYFLKGIDVAPTQHHAAAVVAFGDSITDGAYATENENHRWPDYLAVRLHSNPATANLSVLDEGIGGNCVLIHCVGPNSLARFDRDVLAQAGVKYVIVLESINDIGALHNPNNPDYKLTAQDLEQGLAQLVARAHQHGIKVFGATLTPYKGAGYFTEQGEQIREAVNQWILTSGVFDGTVDFDKATRDPANPLVYAPQYDSGDHLHPRDAGYSAMADSIDLSLFQ